MVKYDFWMVDLGFVELIEGFLGICDGLGIYEFFSDFCR